MITKYTYPPSVQHNNKYFYKYVSPSTALIVLKNNSLRWSHPSLFNDSFELQIGVNTYDKNELRKALKKRAVARFRQCLIEKSTMKYSIGNLIDQSYSCRDFIKHCENFIDDIDEQFKSYSKGYVSLLEKIYEKIRILCLSESYDNILMWAHYADSHRGAVLRFTVQNDELLDDPFVMAQKVQYLNHPMQLSNADEVIDSLFSDDIIPMQYHFPTHCYVKHNIWAYEDEWRLIDIREDGNSKFNDMHFNPTKLSAIYFGCNSDASFKADAIEIAESKYKDLALFTTEMRKDSYEIVTNQLQNFDIDKLLVRGNHASE